MNQTHGMTGTPTWNSWFGMRTRCKYPKLPYFKRYGGRGIQVCKKWKLFENFLLDMGIRPEGKTLDRKNNDGNYSKRNCRWATRKEQANNRRKFDVSGAKNPQAKLKAEDVKVIRASKGVETAAQLGQRFNINSRHVYRIWLNQRWKGV
jgi:hypothetical protein